MNDKDEAEFMGRKVTITIGTVFLTAGLAYFGKMDGDVAMVFATAIGSLNYALRNSN